MPSITQSISATAKKTYNRLKKEHGDELVFEHLLGEYNQYSKIEAEKEKLVEKLDSSKDKIAELTKKLKEKAPANEASLMKSPDTIAMLNETIAAMKSLNETYARENERLLKIVNFSEYDEKINGLKAQIEKLDSECASLMETLKSEKEKAVDFEMKAIKLEEEKTEVEATLAATIKEKEVLVEKVASAEGSKAQLESTVTSYVEELRRYKDKVEEMKTQALALSDQQDTETPTYS